MVGALRVNTHGVGQSPKGPGATRNHTDRSIGQMLIIFYGISL